MDPSSKPLGNATSELTAEPSVWPYILPFIAFMVIASRSPNVGPESVDDIAVNQYFQLVIVQVVVAVGLVAFFFRNYIREFPFRIDIWGFVVGVVGVFLWVGICSLGIEDNFLDLVGLSDWKPERVGFDPFTQITDVTQRNVFLFFRFTLLALMVPIVEELFLRGWFVRYIENPDWNIVNLTSVGLRGTIAVAIYGVATHPGEALAAISWFTLVTWLMVKTGKFWNCVVAHAVTNLLLGLYVIYSGQWHLW